MAKRTRSIGTGGPDPRVRALYAAPPAEFVAARDALSRALAEEGSPDAPRVRRLRRPALAVWLLNAVAREQPDALSTLFAAGDRLRRAQVRAVGGDAAELRTSSAAVRDAVAAGLASARRIAAGQGRPAGAAVLDDVERGLRAVATTDLAARSPLQQGVLDRVPEGGGIELLAGLAAVPPPGPGRRAAAGRQPGRAAKTPRVSRRAREDAGFAADRSARAEAARRERERREALLELDRRDRAVRAAEERVRRAEQDLEAAQRRVTAARAEAAAAQRAARTARARADGAGSETPG